MQVERAIRERRSIRRYSAKIPKDTDIKEILEAGLWAPSGLNNQPWRFKVIKQQQLKEGLASLTKYGKIIKNAPIVICVFLDYGSTYNRDKDLMAIGSCIQNILIRSFSLGLGSCWLGEILNKQKEAQALLGIEQDYELMAVITVGYPDEAVRDSCRKELKSILID